MRKNKVFTFVLVVLFGNSLHATECTKTWSTEGQMKSKKYIFGIGLSSKTTNSEALEEAKVQAVKDVSQQLQSSVKTESKISETENGSSYQGSINLQTDGSNLTGLHFVKEGKDPANGTTACVVAKFDVGASYVEAEGKMNVLVKSLEDISKAAKEKKYIEVLQKQAKYKKLIADSKEDIARADMFRTFLNAVEKSWYERIKSEEVEIDKIAESAKANIVFIFPNHASYEATISDIESRLSGAGFEVSRENKSSKAVQITLEVKDIGTPRKTHTVLGETLIAKIIVNLKDQNGRIIASNKGGTITGTGPTADEALANIDRQLLVNVLETFNSGLPGLIKEEI
jgi:hypothetical protein